MNRSIKLGRVRYEGEATDLHLTVESDSAKLWVGEDGGPQTCISSNRNVRWGHFVLHVDHARGLVDSGLFHVVEFLDEAHAEVCYGAHEGGAGGVWSLPGRINLGRVLAGLGVKELAWELDLSAATIRFYETGERSPRISTLPSLAKCLGLTVADLLGERTWSSECWEARGLA